MSVFVPSKYAEASLATEYTSNASSPYTARIDKFTATNISGADVVLTVHLVPSGGSADNTNKVLVVTIEPDKCYLCGEIVGADLDAGDAIAAFADTASAVVIRCNGRIV